MRTPKETAAHMRERYGKDAGIHCMYAIMSNEGTRVVHYWREVSKEIDALDKTSRSAYIKDNNKKRPVRKPSMPDDADDGESNP
jgi:hypothetical protein